MKTTKATIIAKGDNDGFGKKWAYRGFIIERYSGSDYKIYDAENNKIAFTTNLIHAKELTDAYIRKNS